MRYGWLRPTALLPPTPSRRWHGSFQPLRRFSRGTPNWSRSKLRSPKLGKQGSFRAVRISTSAGQTEYRDLTLEGDRIVRQQVIARYLSDEAAAACLPSSSVEFTPSNYRFRYRKSIEDESGLVYVFDVTPRKRRAGLIRGQLWIDAVRGVVRRQAGQLVRVPSLFLRRVSVTRDTVIRGGLARQVTTHLEIDTRLIGRAELTITERLYRPPAGNPPAEGS